MRYVDEFRDPALARGLVDAIRARVTRPWTVMEVCGGQTHTLLKYGIDRLLPDGVSLVHGPGCPVCVTPLGAIDRALALAARPEVIFCSFGDMLRVPGSSTDLLRVRAHGGDVRVVYGPLDAVRIAAANPTREVVFFAVGFETTAPADALAVIQARRLGLRNFSLLVSHVRVPPAIDAVMADPDTRVQGFLAAGHVCTVTGLAEYAPLVARHRVPFVVTGFEPVDVLRGLYLLLDALERGEPSVQNAYARTVRPDGNPAARAAVDEVFEVCDRAWRGIGVLPMSGLRLRPALADFDAERRFSLDPADVAEPPECQAGRVLQGRLLPPACPAFGTRCTPETPLGATMVSTEGACAAYWAAGRRGQA